MSTSEARHEFWRAADGRAVMAAIDGDWRHVSIIGPGPHKRGAVLSGAPR